MKDKKQLDLIVKPSKLVQDVADLAKSRENFDDMHLPRGNCPTCGKQYRTGKDTKVSWYWLGYMAGQIDQFNQNKGKK